MATPLITFVLSSQIVQPSAASRFLSGGCSVETRYEQALSLGDGGNALLSIRDVGTAEANTKKTANERKIGSIDAMA
ncbi:hypothetical protein Lal_00003448 [Lupinus albus]|nr:hypothetical protein Lal_00003448 [Lupinus albus]